MSEREILTVKNRRRYRVDISRLVDEQAEIRRHSHGLAPNRARRDQFGSIVGRLHDGGSRITTLPRRGTDTSDLVNRFAANHYEAGPFPTISQIDVVRRDLVARADLPAVAYEHSGRMSRYNMTPIGATTEMDGVAMGLYLERRKVVSSEPQAKLSYGVASYAPWIHPMRSPLEQLADYDDSAADLLDSSARARIERLQLEGFDVETAGRAQRDLAFVPGGLSPGMYCPSFSGGAVYHSFDPLDTTNFHCSTQASTSGPAVVPWMPVGDGVASTFDLIAEPKLFRIQFTWVSVYIVIVLFAPPTLVIEVNLGSYSDRLPLGFAYAADPEQSVNDAVMSRWIRESNRYALAINQDIGRQVFSPYFIMILVARVDGLWEFFSPQQNIGDLAGILDLQRGGFGARRDRHFVYRKTAIPGGATVDDVQGFGSLHVPGEVTGHTKGEPTFSGGRPYEPF